MLIKVKKHIQYYVSLTLILFFGLFLLFFANGDKQLQMIITLLSAFFYTVWGIIHHYLEHDIHAKIVVEYVLTGVLGITVVFLLLY